MQSTMRAKILTLRYSPTLGRFDDSCVQEFVRDKEVLSIAQQLFVVHEVAHLLCVVHWQEQRVSAPALQATRAVADPTPALARTRRDTES